MALGTVGPPTPIPTLHKAGSFFSAPEPFSQIHLGGVESRRSKVEGEKTRLVTLATGPLPNDLVPPTPVLVFG